MSVRAGHTGSIIRRCKPRAHPRAYHVKHAPDEGEEHGIKPEPYLGPRTEEGWIAQLSADPEFTAWQREERAAHLGMLTMRAHHTSDEE